MVNPLSRVAMRNIIEKDNPVDKQKVKTLSDFAKNTQQNTKAKSISNSYNKNNYNTKVCNKNINIKSDEKISSLIKDVIHGEAEVNTNKSRNTGITLEQAANKIKNNR